MNTQRKFKAFHYMDGPGEIQYLSEKKLMQWGIDDAQNHDYDTPTTPEEAIEILHDIGDVTVEEILNEKEHCR